MISSYSKSGYLIWGAYAKQQHHKALATWDRSCRNMVLPSLWRTVVKTSNHQLINRKKCLGHCPWMTWHIKRLGLEIFYHCPNDPRLLSTSDDRNSWNNLPTKGGFTNGIWKFKTKLSSSRIYGNKTCPVASTWFPYEKRASLQDFVVALWGIIGTIVFR